jgi:hypothetical protein
MSYHLSIEKSYPDFAEACHALPKGSSAYSGFVEIPFDLHRYRDGWHIYWKNPPNDQIGRHLKTRMELNAFLTGNWRVGKALAAPAKKGLVFQRPSSREN